MLRIIRIVIASVVLIAQPFGGLCDVDAALPKAGTQSLLAQEMEAKKDILEKHVTLLETQMYELDEKIKQVKTQLEEDKQTEASLDARLKVHKEGKEKNIKLQSDTLVAASAKAHAKVEKGFGEEAPHLKHKGCEKEKESSHKASQVSDIDSETPEKDNEESDKKDAEGDDDADKQVDDANKEVQQQEDKDDGDSLLAKTAKQTAEEVKEPGSKGSSFLQENAKASSTPDDDLSIMEPLQENSARMERYYNLLQEQLKKARTVIKYKTVMIEKEENDLVLLKTLQEAIEEGKKVLRDGQKTTIQHMFSALKETAAAATEGQKDEKDEDKNEDNAEDKSNDASKPAEDKSNDASKPAEDKNNDASKPAEDKSNDASKPAEDKSNDASKPAEDNKDDNKDDGKKPEENKQQ